MRRTLVVRDRNAWRSLRARTALRAEHGVQVLTIEQLAARLAGGFLQPIDPDAVKGAIGETLALALGPFDAIKDLPGFRRAAAATLHRVWTAGVDLDAAVVDASDPAVAERLGAMAALEREVLGRLPAGMVRPCDLVARAVQRAHHARSVLGRVEISGHTELAPVWRPLLPALAPVIEVTWVADAQHVPEWLAATGVAIARKPPTAPRIEAVSCATPQHEILEALRWARERLASGVPPREVGIAAASPGAWDAHVLALAESANLPVHFAHGRAALTSADGQLAAALAEVLLRGLSERRVARLVALLRTQTDRFAEVPGSWRQALPEGAPLLTAARWQQAIEGMDRARFKDAPDPRPLLGEIVTTVALGLGQAAAIGERLLEGRARAIWTAALAEGPPAALDVTLDGLRIDDGLEPEATILWAPASSLAATPRPYTWLVGLTSRSWPRRAAEDPLLPDHVIPATRLDPLPAHLADRRDFDTLLNATARELVCSRARRDSEGRVSGTSPLYPKNLPERHLTQSREPEHAASASDRLLARPSEFRALPVARSAHAAWTDWHAAAITAHDGLIRAGHPLLLAALDRRQSASSLAKLLRDPLGYLWTYGFGWSVPDETEEPLNLDAPAFGTLLHEVLEASVSALERAGRNGLAGATPDELARETEAACATVGARWSEMRATPPPIIWRRKLAEARDFALAALSNGAAPLPAQRSWAEIAFGWETEEARVGPGATRALPWDSTARVIVPGTDIAIRGLIDRLDLAGDGSRARVTDYKSGKSPPKGVQLKGGAELQRCLYAFAVRALAPGTPDVEAQLLFPRTGETMLLDDPVRTLERLTGYLTAAAQSFMAGKALPGPAASGDHHDLAFALPGAARESYLATKNPLVAAELAAVAPLWDEV